MTDFADLALLPEGLHDELPPRAQQQADSIARLTAVFDGHGYDLVEPPLVEFEESLLAGPGAGVSRHMFRLMDPISQRMMCVRADLTTQVARIAATRLAGRPRPLRLCYAGQVLRVRGTQLRPERQFAQAGAELIGADCLAADAEVVMLAADAAAAVGICGLSVDLTVPSLVTGVCQSLGLSASLAERVRLALDQKDRASLAELPAEQRQIFLGLLQATGPAETALPVLDRLVMTGEMSTVVMRLAELVRLLRAQAPELVATVDPAESRGFQYESGVSFTLFARGVRGELGRGGRYALSGGEGATGFSLYLDSLMRAIPEAAARPLVYLPPGVPRAEQARLRGAGWRLLAGFAAGPAEAEARRLNCTHLLRDGIPVALS
ncbi:MAG: ATP phosphoribosyltransferase regulatory subunit [Alphaproteobacteria bacterium]|nr:ATP phosphoribosyltransferase regulatory subunit [Alphaproteobacteria bacterium]